MVAFAWDSARNEDDLPDLPEPDVEFLTGDQEPDRWTEAGIKEMVMNPVYAGVGGFPPYVSDKQWVAACKRVMEQDSPEQFLVNLLFVLRETFWGRGKVTSVMPRSNQPGDIAVEGKSVRFYFPVVTCIILSVPLTAILSW